MAFIYNIERCNALHRFCKENGYGYLIIDDRGNSIYDIRSREVAPDLVAYFNTILENQTMIVWRNIKDIKLTRPVSNADIAAYVLQNKLHFTMEPFCIKRRGKTSLDWLSTVSRKRELWGNEGQKKKQKHLVIMSSPFGKGGNVTNGRSKRIIEAF